MKLRIAKDVDALPTGRITICKDGHCLRLIDIDSYAFEAASTIVASGIESDFQTKAQVIGTAMERCNWGLAKNGYLAYPDGQAARMSSGLSD